MLVLTNIRICVRIDGVVAGQVPRGVPHAPILEARPHWWRSHGARRLYRCRDSSGDAAPPCGLSAAAADPAESPAGGDSDLDRAARAASSDANRIIGAAGARARTPAQARTAGSKPARRPVRSEERR